MKEDQIAEFLERKLEWWSFSRLLGEVYRGEEALSSRLNRKLSEYGRSSEEDRESATFPLSDEGMDQAIAWLFERYDAEKDRWAAALQDMMHTVKRGGGTAL